MRENKLKYSRFCSTNGPGPAVSLWVCSRNIPIEKFHYSHSEIDVLDDWFLERTHNEMKGSETENSHFILFLCISCLLIEKFTCVTVDATGNDVTCLDDAKFYRNPDRHTHALWSYNECSKYYLCLDGDVFEFKCSVGLLFDVIRQICDFKQNVDNCDITARNFKYTFMLAGNLTLRICLLKNTYIIFRSQNTETVIGKIQLP